jgi:hypothetical protein
MSLSLILAGLAALQAPAPAPAPAAAQPDLDWLAGYWLSCEDGRDVSETWSVRRGGILLGYAVTTGRQAFSWEQMRIEAGLPGPDDLSFFAQPRGADTATPFRLVRSGPREAVFENMANDFPKRVIYRRAGDRLIGRIEGADGQALEWRYNAAPLNSRCPR